MSLDGERFAGESTPDESEAVATEMSQRFSWWRVTFSICAILVVLIPVLIYADLSGFYPSVCRAPAGVNIEFTQGSAIREIPAFDLSKLIVPQNEIFAGGPAKDGIPALSQPLFIDAEDATYLNPNDRVIGVAQGTEARAYPLKILNYHEIVNDRFGDVPFAVTYCPLCDSAAAFDRRTLLGEREFGVSGLLYNSNVLMYDRTKGAESLWSQLMATGISGPGARKKLKSVPIELTTWSEWTRLYPESRVLSSETGHRRNYDRSPYAGYFQTPQLMFPAQPYSDRLPTKERVLGVWSGETCRAYPESAFNTEQNRVEDQISGKRVLVEFVSEANSLRVAEAEAGVEWTYSLWFAWYAMHPDTEVFQPEL